MKAIVYEKYGPPDVLELRELETPLPADNELLIKVHATTVSPVDWHFRSGRPFLARLLAGGLLKPKITILGFDIAGEIESAGKDVRKLKVGDPVYGIVPVGANGATAQYICVSEKDVIKKPVSLTYEEAAAVPTASTIALAFLKAGGIQSGQRVLINGASGGLGTFALQLARYFGAEVTGVCSTPNLKMVRSLGADEVIDYTSTDFTRNGQTYDLIFDAAGKSTFPRCKASLTREGVYVSTMVTFQILRYMLLTAFIGSKKAKSAKPSVSVEDLKLINDLIEAGKVKPVIDRCYAMEQIAEAHIYAETGHARGKIIVTVAAK
jgi:NADPH:quinone reductase-like Zn-dependent oxidoreductase